MRAKAWVMVLPNQMGDDDNKALGLGYIVEEDKLHVCNQFLKEKEEDATWSEPPSRTSNFSDPESSDEKRVA